MLTAIVHALFNSSLAAGFSYLILQCAGGIDAAGCRMVPAVIRLKTRTDGPIRKGLATQ